MFKLIKKILSFCLDFFTSMINQGQNLISNKFHKNLCKRNKITSYNKKDYQKNKNYLKSFGYHSNKVDFILFSHYIKNKEEKIKIIPSSIVNQFVTPILNPIEYRGYYEDKNSFDKIFPPGVLPNTILRRINGYWFDSNYKPVVVSNDEDLFQYINENQEILIKPTKNSSAGKSIEIFYKEDTFFKSKMSNTLFSLQFINNKWGKSDLIIQEVLKQSDSIAKFNKSSVNTFRVAIYNSPIDNKPHLLWGVIRIGGEGSIVDNAHAGGIFVGINKDGKLNNFASNVYGDIIESHNGIIFSKEHYITDFIRIINFAKDCAIKLLPNRFIALDIMMDNTNNPRLIEYNLSAFSDWFGFFSGFPSLGKYNDEILHFCKENRHNNKKAIYYLS